MKIHSTWTILSVKCILPANPGDAQKGGGREKCIVFFRNVTTISFPLHFSQT